MSTTPSPTPAKSRWSRMGAVVRRSTLLGASRPTTPSNNSERDSDSVSLSKQKIDTSSGGTAPHLTHLASAPPESFPSPIAETPREAVAGAENDIKRSPSTLGKQADTTFNMPPASRQEEALSPQEYVPPPLIDSKAGNPGAFTDDPDSLPQPQIAHDPFASSSRVDLPNISNTSSSDPRFVDEPEAFVDESQEEPAPRPQIVDEPKPFFYKPMVSGVDHETHRDFATAVEENTTISPPVASSNYSPKFVPQIITPPIHDAYDDFPDVLLPSHHDDPATAPVPIVSSPAPVFSVPSYDYHVGHNVWAGKPDEHATPQQGMPVPVLAATFNQGNDKGNTRDHTQEPTNRDSLLDPVVAPRIETTHSNNSHYSNAIHMPTPQHQHPPILNQEDASGSIQMPLPAFRDVVPNKPLHQQPSTASFIFDRQPLVQTDEARPLLGVGTSQGLSYQATSNILDVSPLSSTNGNARPWVPNVSGSATAPAPRLHELGWLEYHLPDGTFYYVHPTRKITTDVNLRLDKSLSNVTNFLESGTGAPGSYGVPFRPSGGHVGNGNGKDVQGTHSVEVWLRDIGAGKKGAFVPVRCYVDHHVRTVTTERTFGNGRNAKGGLVDEDQLDMEFRYWSFMEAHPAHTTLPAKAKAEAMDVLTWAWTDRLLPSHRAVPAPFSQDECQELMTLLRGFRNDNTDDHGIQNRIVSRILLRVAIWRQKYFRPDKPLPKDVSSNQLHLPAHKRRLYRVFLDLVISCVCLGIPYLFLERSRIGRGRLDEESGTLGSGMRGAGHIFVVGACTCLVAAIVLSASVTFLALPGLESFSRTAVLVAILLASFAMASTLVAVFKYKADMERPSSVVGLEGLTNLSGRAVVLSLPLVFLTYSIISFITGIAIYSLRGGSLFDPNVTVQPFEDYTKWVVIGLVGAFGGVFVTSYFTARR